MDIYLIFIIALISTLITLFTPKVQFLQKIYYIFFNINLALLISASLFYNELLSNYISYFIIGFITLIIIKIMINSYFNKKQIQYKEYISYFMLNTIILAISMNVLLLTVLRYGITESLNVQVQLLIIMSALILLFRFIYKKDIHINIRLTLAGIVILSFITLNITHRNIYFSSATYHKDTPFLYRGVELEKIGQLSLEYNEGEAIYATQSTEEYFYFVIGVKDRSTIRFVDETNEMDAPMRLYAYHYDTHSLNMIYESKLAETYRQNFIDLIGFENQIYLNTQSGLKYLNENRVVPLYEHEIYDGDKELDDFYGTLILEGNTLYYDTLNNLYKIENRELKLLDFHLQDFGYEGETFIYRISYLGVRHDAFKNDTTIYDRKYHFRRHLPFQSTSLADEKLTINNLSSHLSNQHYIPIEEEGLIDGDKAKISISHCMITFNIDHTYRVRHEAGAFDTCHQRFYINETNISVLLIMDYDEGPNEQEATFYHVVRAAPIINPYFITIFSNNYYYGILLLVIPTFKKPK